MSVSVHSRQLALRPSNRADKERRVSDTPRRQAGQRTDDLVDQLLGRWNVNRGTALVVPGEYLETVIRK